MHLLNFSDDLIFSIHSLAEVQPGAMLEPGDELRVLLPAGYECLADPAEPDFSFPVFAEADAYGYLKYGYSNRGTYVTGTGG